MSNRVLHVLVPVDDELSGRVEIKLSFRELDVPKVLSWKPDVAKLYLGGAAPYVQNALRVAWK